MQLNFYEYLHELFDEFASSTVRVMCIARSRAHKRLQVLLKLLSQWQLLV